MLKKLLQLVVTSNTQSPGSLAQALDATPSMVEDMLRSLVIQGYLRDVNLGGGCSSGSCSMRSSCSTSSCDTPKVWEVTAKGKKLLGME